MLYLIASVAYCFVEIFIYCPTCLFTALLVALLVGLRSYSGVWYSPCLFLLYLVYIYYLLCVIFSSSALALSLVLSRLLVVVGSEEYYT